MKLDVDYVVVSVLVVAEYFAVAAARSEANRTLELALTAIAREI
jgi:hypothetical protein